MRLVADANEIFSFFNETSKARELSLSPELELHSPYFSLEEIKEHKSEVLDRFTLSETQYLLIEKLLKTIIEFVKENKYSEFLEEAKEISLDPDDVEYFALALKLKCPIWSEDPNFKKQSKVKVYDTSELLKELGLK